MLFFSQAEEILDRASRTSARVMAIKTMQSVDCAGPILNGNFSTAGRRPLQPLRASRLPAGSLTWKTLVRPLGGITCSLAGIAFDPSAGGYWALKCAFTTAGTKLVVETVVVVNVAAAVPTACSGTIIHIPTPDSFGLRLQLFLREPCRSPHLRDSKSQAARS